MGPERARKGLLGQKKEEKERGSENTPKQLVGSEDLFLTPTEINLNELRGMRRAIADGYIPLK